MDQNINFKKNSIVWTTNLSVKPVRWEFFSHNFILKISKTGWTGLSRIHIYMYNNKYYILIHLQILIFIKTCPTCPKLSKRSINHLENEKTNLSNLSKKIQTCPKTKKKYISVLPDDGIFFNVVILKWRNFILICYI